MAQALSPPAWAPTATAAAATSPGAPTPAAASSLSAPPLAGAEQASPHHVSASGPRRGLPRLPFTSLRFERKLGSGAYGDVEEREWQSTRVAVKCNGLKATDKAALDNEVVLYGVVHENPHPGIVQVLGVCTDAPDGQVRIIMRLCEKGSLEGILHSARVKVRASACSQRVRWDRFAGPWAVAPSFPHHHHSPSPPRSSVKSHTCTQPLVSSGMVGRGPCFHRRSCRGGVFLCSGCAGCACAHACLHRPPSPLSPPPSPPPPLRAVQGGVPLSTILTVGQQVVGALRHLHSLGIIHRDVRAANVLIASLDPIMALLADFGVSHQLSAFAGGAAAVPLPASKVTSVLTGDRSAGPVLWTAPEVLLGGRAGAVAATSSDVYMVGGLLWELLTAGHPPYFWCLRDVQLLQARLASGVPVVVPGPHGTSASWPGLRGVNTLHAATLDRVAVPYSVLLAPGVPPSDAEALVAAVKAVMMDCLNADPERRPRVADLATRLAGIAARVHVSEAAAERARHAASGASSSAVYTNRASAFRGCVAFGRGGGVRGVFGVGWWGTGIGAATVEEVIVVA
jgi:serine/threonine protein kinase